MAPLAVLVTGLYVGGMWLLLKAGCAAVNAFYLMGLGSLRGLGNVVRALLFNRLFTVLLALGLILLISGLIKAQTSVLIATACLIALMAIMFAPVWRLTRSWGSMPMPDAPSPWVEGIPMMLIGFLMFFG